MSATQLIFIQLSGIVGLPLLLVGEAIGKGQTLTQAIICCLIGNGFLTILALFSSKKIIEYRCSTSNLMQHTLGNAGRAIMALLIFMSMLFWFCLQTHIIAHSLFPNTSPQLTVCLIGLILSIATIKGLSMIEKISFLTAPCMLIAIGIAMMSPSKHSVALSPISYAEGISIAIGGAILGVIDLPTFFQQAKSLSSARKAIFISFFIAISFIECCGIFLTHKGISVTEALTHSSSQLSLYCVISAACVANMSNLYSATQSLTSIFKIDGKKAILLTGLTGTFFSQFHLFTDLAIILSAASSTLIVFGSVLIFDSFIHSSKKVNWIAIGIGLSVNTYELIMGVSLSKIPTIDVLIVTIMSLILLKGALIYENTHN